MPVEIDRNDVERLVAQGGQLIDVLPRSEYETVHLKGALNLPLAALDREAAVRLDSGRPVILYCYDRQ